MRIAAGSDEKSELTDALVEELEKRGYEPVVFHATGVRVRKLPIRQGTLVGLA